MQHKDNAGTFDTKEAGDVADACYSDSGQSVIDEAQADIVGL